MQLTPLDQELLRNGDFSSVINGKTITTYDDISKLWCYAERNSIVDYSLIEFTINKIHSSLEMDTPNEGRRLFYLLNPIGFNYNNDITVQENIIDNVVRLTQLGWGIVLNPQNEDLSNLLRLNYDLAEIKESGLFRSYN